MVLGEDVLNRETFERLLWALQRDECEINQTKGREYAQGDEDALANFKQAGEFVRVRCPECGHAHPIGPQPALMVYLFKHFASLASFATNGHVLSDEPIAGRVADLRLYAALLYALALEAGDEATKVPAGSD